MLQRLSEFPLKTTPSRDYLTIGSPKDIKRYTLIHKKIQNILTVIHIHPCYIYKLYKNPEFSLTADDFYKFIKMIYPNKHPAEQQGSDKHLNISLES